LIREKGGKMEPSKVVVRFRDGKIVKGYTRNFFPNKPTFHVHPRNATNPDELLEISIDDLKAVFFVRDFLGNRTHKERKKVSLEDKPQGRFLEVTCKDNEVIIGSSAGYDAKRPGFFVFFLDTLGNNIKAYIVSAAVSKVRYL